MNGKVKEAMEKLFAARWNVPTAAKHCEKNEREVKDLFRLYCSMNPITRGKQVIQEDLLGGPPVIM